MFAAVLLVLRNTELIEEILKNAVTPFGVTAFFQINTNLILIC